MSNAACPVFPEKRKVPVRSLQGKRPAVQFLLSLFARRRTEEIIRQGVMYRLTYKGARLVKEEALTTFGGFTRLNDVADNRTVGDRKRTDLNHSSPVVEQTNFTRKPDVI